MHVDYYSKAECIENIFEQFKPEDTHLNLHPTQHV